MARYRESDPPDVIAAIKSTGGAVGLCSLTTIIGYGSLLFAQNQALFLFGLVAVLGEVACLLTAVVVLPAALVLLKRRSPPWQRRGRDLVDVEGPSRHYPARVLRFEGWL